MTSSACNLSRARPRRSRFAPTENVRFKDPDEPNRNSLPPFGIPRRPAPLTRSMPHRRLIAALLAGAVSIGASVLAACELACSFDPPPAAAVRVPAHPAHCHESSPATPSRCSERHALRLAVVDSGVSPALAAPLPEPLWIPPAPEPIGVVLPSLASTVLPSSSPPLILRV